MARRLSSPVLIGRDDDLARCLSLIRETGSGQGACILVTGEAGIGKTRLSQELGRAAARDGWLVCAGACDQFSQARPFAPLVEMLPALREFVASAASGEFDSPGWEAIEKLADAEAARTAPQAGSVSHLVLDLFRRLSGVRPLVLVFDDLHWADASTLELFGMLPRGLSSSPAVVVGCYRADEVGRGHPLREVVGVLHRNTRPEVITLEPLDAQAVVEFAREVGADEADAAMVAARSGGIPFVIEELLGHSGTEVPAAIADAVFAKLDTMGEDAATIAEALSLETILSIDLISAATGIAPRESGSVVDLMVERGLFAAAAGGVSFRHALGRDAVASRIPPGRRRELNARLASAFESAAPPDIARASHHWHEAGHVRNTVRTSFIAARQANASGAFHESLDMYKRVLDLWDVLPDARELVGRSFADVSQLALIAGARALRYAESITVGERALNRPEACARPGSWPLAGHRLGRTVPSTENGEPSFTRRCLQEGHPGPAPRDGRRCSPRVCDPHPHDA